MSMQNFSQKLEMNMRSWKKKNKESKIELHKYRNYFQSMPQKLYQKPLYTKPIRKRRH